MTAPGRAGRGAGRRPAGSTAREDILAAARRGFAEAGYERTTIRGVARAAGVDPALVHHYFGGKQALLAACLDLPADPAREFADAVAGGPPGEAGARLVRRALTLWEATPYGAAFESLLRAAVSNEEAAGMLRAFIRAALAGPVAAVLGERPDTMLRAELAGSHLAGLFLARRVLRVEPLASASHDTLVAAVGPTVQRYLTGDLDGPKS